ncbi:MAG: hypothetical protein QNJ94_09420 [Alphaproteobacteria bacterium]|nr:hypothetical protein [Alphaproteobacteria bacterium]
MRTWSPLFKPAFVLSVLILPLLAAPAAGETKKKDLGITEAKIQAVKWCKDAGANAPEAFAFCTSGFLTDAEIRKCVGERGCFGSDLVGMPGFAACNTPEAKRVFGQAAGCGAKKCTGNPGRFYVVNMAGDPVWPNTISDCAPQDRFTASPGQGAWLLQGPGVMSLRVWGGGLTGPGAKSGGAAKIARDSTNVDGLTEAGAQTAAEDGTWELVSGRMYKLDYNKSGQVVPFDITPRYEGKPKQ